ncbi:MAG: aldehyde dehydrogenase family protein [Cytophagales bacterium]|nr:aldehyde dehydrogenase family protein [Cytophaga sp.]
MNQGKIQEVMNALGVQKHNAAGMTEFQSWNGVESFVKTSPIDGSVLAEVESGTKEVYNTLIEKAEQAFLIWRTVPAPKRGEVIRQIGDALRIQKQPLGTLISLETGKLLQEGLGEVQEMIDICDFAVGLSRQLYGLTMHSERPDHRMYDQYHPLGIIGIISAFNFPAAVWSWNAIIAAVCGNVSIWKPSEKAPLSAIACQHIVSAVVKKNNLPEGIFTLIHGKAEQGSWIAADERIALVSATGSVAMGKKVNQIVAERLGKTLLELGGNNAIIVTEHADLEMAVRAIVFGAVGTSGQRCTTTRRLIVHDSVYDILVQRLTMIYQHITIGNPLEEGTLVGPLIDEAAINQYESRIDRIQKEGGSVIYGGKRFQPVGFEKGYYVLPALIEAAKDLPSAKEETFAPILYVIKYSGDVEHAIAINNNVPQGLSSSIFTTNMRQMELFLSSRGSDCGIANINIGTSGAEIGGAFGGEKETGGGRESGSDSWKAYMRRQTNTINYGTSLPLAQGIRFDV